MPRLEKLSWNQLVEELRSLAEHKPAPGEAKDDPKVVLHELLVHQVELEMQNRELRDAQQQLEASRARYADLYDFAPVGCLSIDADERIREINLTGAALLGRDRAEVVGRPFLGVVPLHEKSGLFHDHVRRCMGDRCRVDDEIEFVPKGRGPMVLHMTSSPLLDADGKAIGCRTALTDVTDRRRAECAEAEARLRDEFLGTVSHELRTPLTAIVGWVDVLQQRGSRDAQIDPRALRHGLEVIQRNAMLQARLVEDILDVSRILAGKLRVERRPLDLGPLVRASVENLGPGAQAKAIALSVGVAQGSVVVGDSVRLAQVMTNLLGNALKFTPSGGKIEVDVTTDPQSVRITVRDTGRGIARQDLPHVFERFRQVDTSTTRTTGGLGLGLAIVEHIVRAHGGEVTASSPGLGLGATFTVRLPRALVAEESEEVAAPAPSDGPSLEGCDVLCVDDDGDTLEMVALALKEHGAGVRTARSAAQALEALAASTPSVVVSDIGLPVQDGYALVRAIRGLPGDAARVPAIALTAYAGAAAERDALAAGFQRFLSKPVLPEALARAVADVARCGAATSD